MSYYDAAYKDGRPFCAVTFPYYEKDGIVIDDLQLQETIDYINEKGIKSACIFSMDNFQFLEQCANLEHLAIHLELPIKYYSGLERKGSKLIKEYDVTPLYKLKNLKSLSITNAEELYIITKFKVDLGRFPKLEEYIGDAEFVENIENAVGLKTLWLDNYQESTLENLANLKLLDTLELCSSKLISLKGCESLPRLQCLYLYYNRKLADISELKRNCNSLKALRIENSAKVNDFTVLGDLKNLELLGLIGSNKIDSISVLRELKKLKTFVFDIEILDGDITPCLPIQYVGCLRCRRYYNLREKDLPDGEYVRGNEDIDLWRRLE